MQLLYNAHTTCAFNYFDRGLTSRPDMLKSFLFPIQGLRVQDSRQISPWDMLEGVKNSGPLMLSWFGAVRMKRKPLTYEEQGRLVQFHTHQNHLQDMMYKPHYVSLPEPATQEESKPEEDLKATVDPNVKVEKTPAPPADVKPVLPTASGSGVLGVPPAPMPPPSHRNPGPPPPVRPQLPAHMPFPPRRFSGPAIATQQNMREKLKEIERQHRIKQLQQQQSIQIRGQVSPYGSQPTAVHQPPYGVQQPVQLARPPMHVGYNEQQIRTMRMRQALMQMSPEQRMVYMHRARQQQLQQQAMGMRTTPMYSHQTAQYPVQQPMHAMRPGPIQASPAMPMHQMMQQQGYSQQQQMVLRAQGQQPMQYPQQPHGAGGMSQMSRQMF